jgi:pimeloyl-ACP methyl ester carboxylesterase
MLDAGVDLGESEPAMIAAEICVPAELSEPALAFICLPGGSINRRYYDLGGDEQPSFSFARQMAEHGLITISIDHLGIGESTRPEDSFRLTPNAIVAANAHATRLVVQGLKEGTLVPSLPSLPDLTTVGVGHSMGGMLTVMQQALDPVHKALVLLGFSCNGLVDYLPQPAHALIGRPEEVPHRIVDVARQVYPTGAVEMPPSTDASAMFYGSRADRGGVEALKAARDKLLVMPGTQSMIPGSIAPQARAIDMPIFLALGDQDIAGPPHAIPASFPGSKDITLLILPETGHCQFIFPSRKTLFPRIAGWSRAVATSHR